MQFSYIIIRAARNQEINDTTVASTHLGFARGTVSHATLSGYDPGAQVHVLSTLSISTYPWVPGRPGEGCSGGQSSTCQFAGISTTPDGLRALIGCIQSSAGRERSVETYELSEVSGAQ